MEFDIPKGAAGASGSTPNIQVQPRINICDDPSDAKVERTGSITQPILEFTLPRGPQGEKGETGATGAQGPKGDTGAPGNSGYSTESWTFSLENGSTVTKKVVLN